MSDNVVLNAPATDRSLPAGWRWARLGDVIREVQGGFASGERDPHGVIQLRMNNVTSRGSFDWSSFIRVPADAKTVMTYQLQAGDVLFNNTNSTELVGKTALFEHHDEPVVYSNHFTRLRTVADQLSPAFLALWLQEQWHQRVFADICNRWIGQSAVQRDKLLAHDIPLPPLPEQRRLATLLAEQLAAVDRARRAAEAQVELSIRLVDAYLRQSLSTPSVQRIALSKCLIEVSKGVGIDWKHYRVIGATRAGSAPARARVGKDPERYKLVEHGTVFYNPMRILLGSIGMVDDGDEPGITSPDYVVVKSQDGVLHPRWFYYWFRSRYGEAFIKALTRGAVRERLLFRRLAAAEIEVPPWDAQQEVAERLRLVGHARNNWRWARVAAEPPRRRWRARSRRSRRLPPHTKGVGA